MANPSPTINFRVNLTLLTSEAFGPVTNESSVGVLHPDRHQDDQDNAQVEYANRKNCVSTYLPSLQIRPNLKLVHGDTFTAYGQKAVYLRDTYGVGYAPADRAVLEIV